MASMATARKAKKLIIQFGVKGQKKCVSVLCCFLLHIDLFTHSADSRPFKSFVQSLDSWYIDKKACRPLYRYHSQHKPPGTIHPPILHIGILDSLRNRSRDQINDLYYHRVPVPFWDRHPGSGLRGWGWVGGGGWGVGRGG